MVVVTFFAYPSKFGAFGAYGGAGVDDVDTGLFGATLDVPAFQPGQGQVGVLGGPVVVVVVRDRFAENGFGLRGVVGGGGGGGRGFGRVGRGAGRGGYWVGQWCASWSAAGSPRTGSVSEA